MKAFIALCWHFFSTARFSVYVPAIFIWLKLQLAVASCRLSGKAANSNFRFPLGTLNFSLPKEGHHSNAGKFYAE